MAELFDLTLAEAARRIPSKPHASAVWRWCRKGVKARNGNRIYLDHQRFGGKLFTTEDAIQRFVEAVTCADREHFETEGTSVRQFQKRPRRRTEKQRQLAIDAAEKRLREAGF